MFMKPKLSNIELQNDYQNHELETKSRPEIQQLTS